MPIFFTGPAVSSDSSVVGPPGADAPTAPCKTRRRVSHSVHRPSFTLQIGATQPPAGDSVTGRAWGGNSNTNLNLTNLLAVVGPTSVSPFAASASGLLNPTTNPYSLTIGVVITRTVAGTSTGDLNFTATAIPEPATMTLFGLGLTGFVAAQRRRKARQPK